MGNLSEACTTQVFVSPDPGVSSDRVTIFPANYMYSHYDWPLLSPGTSTPISRSTSLKHRGMSASEGEGTSKDQYD